MKKIGALALVAAMGLPLSASAAMQSLSNLFVFGDSLSDGGNSGIVSQDAIGVTFPPLPYYNGQYSNGPAAVEYLWQRFNPGDTTFRPSLADGTNYAIGGATSGLESYNSVNSNVPGALQSAYAQKGNSWELGAFATQSRSFDPATSLFVVWYFPNDVFYWAQTGELPGTALGVPGGPGDGSDLVANGIQNIVNTVGFLASHGAQHFLVPNMPDLGQVPSSLGTANAPVLSFLTTAFNTNLAPALTQVASALSLDIVQFKTDEAFHEFVGDPSVYGFENVTESCVDNLLNGRCNPDTWLFWDGAHPTTAASELLAQRFHAAVVPEPATYALFAFGLAGLLAWSRRRAV